MMILLELVLVIVGLLSVSGVKTDYTLCGPGTQYMDVKTIDFTSGDSKSSLNMVLKPNASTTVTSGTISGEMYRKTLFGGKVSIFISTCCYRDFDSRATVANASPSLIALFHFCLSNFLALDL